MSIGLGIHGEPGVRDVPLQTASDLAVTLAEPLLAERPEGCTRAVVILNGLGSVKYEELFVLFGSVAEHLESQGIEIVEPECGEFVTSLDMAGVSLTVLWLDDELEELWRAPASAPGFRKGSVAVTASGAPHRDSAPPRRNAEAAPATRVAASVTPEASRRAALIARRMLQQARAAVGAEVEHLGELDAVAGDGDHGIGMLRGLNAAVDATGAVAEGTGVRRAARESRRRVVGDRRRHVRSPVGRGARRAGAGTRGPRPVHLDGCRGRRRRRVPPGRRGRRGEARRQDDARCDGAVPRAVDCCA